MRKKQLRRRLALAGADHIRLEATLANTAESLHREIEKRELTEEAVRALAAMAIIHADAVASILEALDEA